MRRGLVLGFAALFLIWLIGAEAPVSAGMNVNVNIGVPAVVVSEPPEMVMVPNSRVYFAPNVEADLFFYRGGWYSHRGDRWFRAGSYEGPWVVVAPGAVPVEIVRVPRSYRTVYVREEHVPYGHLKRHWKMREREKHAWKEHKHRYKPDRDEDDD